MPDQPNQKAVEALARSRVTRDSMSGNYAFDRLESYALKRTLKYAAEDLKAAEPHIRSQLLTELAEEFEEKKLSVERENLEEPERAIGRLIAYGDAAKHCRELAAKEESDA